MSREKGAGRRSITEQGEVRRVRSVHIHLLGLCLSRSFSFQINSMQSHYAVKILTVSGLGKTARSSSESEKSVTGVVQLWGTAGGDSWGSGLGVGVGRAGRVNSWGILYSYVMLLVVCCVLRTG